MRRPYSSQDASAPSDMRATSANSYTVESLTKLGEGSFPKVSPDGSRIAFTKEVADPGDPLGFTYEVFTMKTDGSDVTCLTGGKEDLATTRWRGQPYWHPTGRYLTFTAESYRYTRQGIGVTARPGIGRNHNVWIMRDDGSEFWQMTDYPDNWGAIRPSFSHDGKKLLWCEEYSMEKYPNGKRGDRPGPHHGSYWGRENAVFRKGEELGAWRVKIADISFPDGEPVLPNIRAIDPPYGITMIEAEGFTPGDDRLVYSCCDLEREGGMGLWGDIYISDLTGGSLKNLTNSPQVHDENAEFSPDGTMIVWNHGIGLPGQEDLYLMNADGSNKTRLTYFTEPGHAEYDPNAQQITELSWSPDGKYVVFGHVSSESRGGPHVPCDLYKLAFR
ncbi:MAG: hypothetical protein KJ993_17045 [Actinobacteria bacterium]|nr:hypothetical protein [Actinomycetota bacterium]